MRKRSPTTQTLDPAVAILPAGDRVLTTLEFAKRVKLTSARVRQLRASRELLPVIVTSSGQALYVESQAAAFIEERRQHRERAAGKESPAA